MLEGKRRQMGVRYQIAPGTGKQFTDVVIVQAASQAQRPPLCAIRFGDWRPEDLLQTEPKRGIDHLLEGLAQFRRTLLCFCPHIGVQRQGGSHTGILMPRRFPRQGRRPLSRAIQACNAPAGLGLRQPSGAFRHDL